VKKGSITSRTLSSSLVVALLSRYIIDIPPKWLSDEGKDD